LDALGTISSIRHLLFLQTGAIPASALEPEFHEKLAADGNVVKTFYFNKGI
jgi:hypothetical protein